jgi:hypothetical protein
MLRHACGFALANKGHDTQALQAYLGHRNIQHSEVHRACAGSVQGLLALRPCGSDQIIAMTISVDERSPRISTPYVNSRSAQTMTLPQHAISASRWVPRRCCCGQSRKILGENLTAVRQLRVIGRAPATLARSNLGWGRYRHGRRAAHLVHQCDQRNRWSPTLA